jgi:hypothetical protein
MEIRDRKERRNRRKKALRVKKTIALILIIAVACGALIYALIRTGESDSTIRNNIVTGDNTSTRPDNIEPDIEDEEQGPESGARHEEPQDTSGELEDSGNNMDLSPIPADESEVDFVIKNYLNIYVSLINDTELEYYFLDNVVLRNSSFYETVTQEIDRLRQSGNTYELEDYYVNNIVRGITNSELNVEVSQIISGRTEKFIYSLYFDRNGVFIKERK